MIKELVVEKLNFKFNIKAENSTNNKKISQAFITSYKRKLKKPLSDILPGLGFEVRRCNFCNSIIEPRGFDFEIDENTITIVKPVYSNDKLFYCGKQNCPGKSLNANSIEFVSIGFGLSKEDALKFIHSRNSSPFYKENHSSEEEYKKYQTRDEEWYKARNKSFRESIDKGIYHKSLEFYKIKYGEEQGQLRYDNINKNKSITLDNMIRIHGEENGTNIYNNWKNRVANTRENLVAKYGDELGNKKYDEYRNTLRDILKGNHIKDENERLTFLIKRCIDSTTNFQIREQKERSIQSKENFIKFVRSVIVKKYGIFNLPKYTVKCIFREQLFYKLALKKLFSSEDEFFDFYYKGVTPNNKIITALRKNNRGFLTHYTYYTYTGAYLRSKLEMIFFIKLYEND